MNMLDELNALLANEAQLPQHVSNRLIFAAVKETLVRLDDMQTHQEEIMKQLETLNARLEHVEKTQEDYPTFSWLLRNQPIMVTLKNTWWLITVLLMILYGLSHLPEELLQQILNLP